MPGIDVEKTCPRSVPFGDDVNFTITVKNTGNEPLENVSVTDALLGGDITAAFNLPDPLPVGNTVYSHDFDYTPGANEDPVENSVTASGDGVDSGVTDTDTDECETDVTHEPDIARYAQRVIVFKDGRVVEDGPGMAAHWHQSPWPKPIAAAGREEESACAGY